jgi:hypothetical protein
MAAATQRDKLAFFKKIAKKPILNFIINQFTINILMQVLQPQILSHWTKFA